MSIENESDEYLIETPGNNSHSKKPKNNISNLIIKEGNKLNSDIYIKKQFKSMILDQIVKNLSTIEKGFLNLTEYGTDDKSIKKKIGRMLLKPKYKKNSSFFKKFKTMFNKKLYKFLKDKKTQTEQPNKSSPFMFVLCSSATRCIEIQKELKKLKLIRTKKLMWAYAFAKHKSLKEQIQFFKYDCIKNTSMNLIFATPHRLIQLIASDCFDLSQLRYVVIDYFHRDVKLKRFFDIIDIKNDFLKLFFDHLLLYNKEKINIKFLLA